MIGQYLFNCGDIGEIKDRRARGVEREPKKTKILNVRAPIILIINQPLIEGSAYLSKMIKRRPNFLPRIGESLYLTANLYSKVKSIGYSGFNYNYIHIELEPISISHMPKILENSKNGWTYQNHIKDLIDDL